VQVLLTAILPPDKLILFEPAVAVTAPPQLFDNAFGVATTSPAGNMSVKATPASATALAAGLVSVNVRVVVPFNAMVGAPNALAIDGGATTLMLADAVPPVPPSFEFALPEMLFFVPAVVPVTLTEKVHDVLGASDAPFRAMEPLADGAVIVPPPQLPLSALGVDITRPAGKTSLKPTPVKVVLELLFWTVNCKLVVPFSGILAAPNALMLTGGDTTVIDALVVLPVPPSIEVICVLLFFTPAVVP